MVDGQVNFANLVIRHAVSNPERTALVVPILDMDGQFLREESCTFNDLANRIAQARAGLAQHGFKRDDRIILMAPLSIDTYALLLALFASGMSAVFIDAGMGRKKVMQAIDDANAQGIVSVRALIRYRWFLRALWRLKIFGTDCKGFGVKPWHHLFHDVPTTVPVENTTADDHALITFTSGSTGRPKGADRTHGLLLHQHLALSEHFPTHDTCVDLPCFPVVALHNLCLGITTVLPAVNFAAPATVNPHYIFDQIQRWGVSRLSGAPAYVDKLIESIESGQHHASSIESMGVGGAPVSVDLCRRLKAALPECDVQVIYGSTEAEPIASTSIDDILHASDRASSWGHLVGRPAECAQVALVNLPTPPPKLGGDSIEPFKVGPGEVGELLVSGHHVNRGYLDNPLANAAHKLYELNGAVWHRTGDLARIDEKARIWLCGRVKDQIGEGADAIHPLPIEAQINALDGVVRAALISASFPRPYGLFVHTEADISLKHLREHVMDIMNEHTQQPVELIVLDTMPMDYRHQSKIDRVSLRQRLEKP